MPPRAATDGIAGRDPEVIVVGAGPGGSAAAYFLARRGRRVLLLDRQTFPRDKSCGDGLTRAAARLLAEMGLFAELAQRAPAIGGVRAFVKGKGSRDFRYPPGLAHPDHGLVVPRLQLDDAVCRRAVAAGAELRQACAANRLLWSGDQVVGVETESAGLRQVYRAPVVIAADGATSRLARQAGLVATPPEEMGFAIRGYYAGLEGLTDLLEIYLPLLDATDQYLLPSYGWVFPTGPGTANIGVGLFNRVAGSNVREIFTRFLDELRQRDERFAGLQPAGAWQGAPLRFDFSPQACARPGLLLVGDAAGMISPFTGEGISYALEAGEIAAETIDEGLARGEPPGAIAATYARRLARRYTGYFEAGRESARRYLLLWHVLESTFHNERPAFALLREAALFPEGVGETYAATATEDVAPLVANDTLPLRGDLLAVGETLLEAVRDDWPFLARVVAPEQLTPGIPFRPALLLVLAAYLGEPRRPQLQLTAAAMEQGYLAVVAQLGVEEDPAPAHVEDGARPANWGNLFALMVGDFLLSSALARCAQVSPGVTEVVAATLARACEGQVRQMRQAYNQRLPVAEYLDILTAKVATLFELPCWLGAQLAGLPAAEVQALRTYGRQLGLAYQITAECRALQGRRDAYGMVSVSDWRQGFYSLPLLLGLQAGDQAAARLQVSLANRHANSIRPGVASVLEDLADSPAVTQAMDLARHSADRAVDALATLPDHPARTGLWRLANYAVTRRVALSAA